MRAVVLREHGNASKLMVSEVPEPKNSDPDSSIVRNEYAAVNFIDTYHRTGLYRRQLPFVLGREGVGYIGERRVAYFPGAGYQESLVVPNSSLVDVPKELDSKQACSLVAGLTALLMSQLVSLNKDDWVLVYAVSGGVGSLLAQMLRNNGIKVIGTTSPSKLDFAKSLNIEVINRQEDIPSQVMDFTKGQGVRAVFDGVGKDTFETSLQCLAAKGDFISFGNASGKVPPVDLLDLSKKGIKIQRFALTLHLTDLQKTASEYYQMLVDGNVKVEIDKVFPLEKAKEAHEYLESGKSVGKVLLNFKEAEESLE